LEDFIELGKFFYSFLGYFGVESAFTFISIFTITGALGSGLFGWYIDKEYRAKTLTVENGSGGKGGNASVKGSGIAIGGSGGHSGKYGRGGDGGSATLDGDGIAVGGEGGSVDSDVLWHPPARSGYEIGMESSGQPIDPKMRQYGRGGMSAGYAYRYEIVEEIRSDYFTKNNKKKVSALEDVGAVPLNYVNERLSAKGVNWRARIKGLDYEFYIPGN